jgi:hypothetical protein
MYAVLNFAIIFHWLFFFLFQLCFPIKLHATRSVGDRLRDGGQADTTDDTTE